MLMKSTLLNINIQPVFPQPIQHLLNGFYVLFSLTLSINKNVIKIHDNKDVKLLRQDLVYITLKRGWYIN